MSIYSIYKATCIINGKSYIGFTSRTLSVRIKEHQRMRYKSKFYNAVKKYGWNNFEWEVLYQSKNREHTLKEMENHFITEYNTCGKNGYNSTMGGEGILNYSHTEETRKKMSEANKGKVLSEETRKKLSEVANNRTEEYRNKMSEAKKNISDETRKKMSLAQTGRLVSEETKRKMSEAAKNMSEETRKKISESKKGNTNLLGHIHTEETRKKMSESSRKLWKKRLEL